MFYKKINFINNSRNTYCSREKRDKEKKILKSKNLFSKIHHIFNFKILNIWFDQLTFQFNQKFDDWDSIGLMFDSFLMIMAIIPAMTVNRSL